MRLVSACCYAIVLGCAAPEGTGRDDAGVPPEMQEPLPGLALLGNETHHVDNVDLKEIGTAADGLNNPRDLAFNPAGDGELWVVNRRDDSTVTYFNVGTADQQAEKRTDGFAMHFMEESSSIAFGAEGHFGTCGESRNTYDDQADPNDFMGPVLWTSDLSVYAVANPEGLGSHLDMLHESPLCMGIAWESANVYWTFDGLKGGLVRYDFTSDHGAGYDDHSNGIIARYADGVVKRVENVPSHMVVDPASGLLYVADSGNGRIAALDMNSGMRGTTLRGKERGTQYFRMNDVEVRTLVDGETGELQRPSGLAMRDGLLYVTDNATSRITAFNTAGERLDWLDTGLPAGSLMGIDFDATGNLFLVDAMSDRVLKLAPKAR